MTDALAVRSDEGEARWWLGALAIIKATAADTGGNLTLLDVTDPRGVKAPLIRVPSPQPSDYPAGDVTAALAR